MEPLEDILKKIEILKRDLSAEIVTQEDVPKTLVIDKPRIAEPDIQKREVARSKLQKIYDSSKWYTARFTAGMALGIQSDEELNKQGDIWINELLANIRNKSVYK